MERNIDQINYEGKHIIDSSPVPVFRRKKISFSKKPYLKGLLFLSYILSKDSDIISTHLNNFNPTKFHANKTRIRIFF